LTNLVLHSICLEHLPSYLFLLVVSILVSRCHHDTLAIERRRQSWLLVSLRNFDLEVWLFTSFVDWNQIPNTILLIIIFTPDQLLLTSFVQAMLHSHQNVVA